MRSLNFSIFIFCCFIIYPTYQVDVLDLLKNLTASTSKNELAPTQYINQKAPLNHCRIKGNHRAIYHCKDWSYLMRGDTSESKYSIPLNMSSIIDADIDLNSIVYVSKTNFDIIRDNQFIQELKISNSTPILVRIKTRPLYIFTAMISLLDADIAEVDDRILKEVSKEFEIQTYLLGVNQNIHYMRFPKDKLDYELTEDSFIDTLILNDQFYGKDHLLVALKRGWIYIFRTFFQDSEIEFSQAIKLEQDYEILSIASRDVFVVVLMENRENRELKVVLYRINTYSGPILQHQCDIKLDKKLNDTSYKPEVRFKMDGNTFLLLVNFPDDEILSYYFQASPLENLVKACPVKAAPVEHYNKEYGYSLEYVANQYHGLLEEGILFSPVQPNISTSYFVRYCYPNSFWNSSTGCTTCVNGHSRGGAQPQCSPCPTSDKYTLVANGNPMIETCAIVCHEKDRFGPSCLPCDEYMKSMNATLPQGSHWGVDEKGQCSFICGQDLYADLPTGACISKSNLEVKADHCIQVKDCLNCSFTPSCGWCGGSCRQFSKCYGNVLKSSVVQNFIYPALDCEERNVCGKTNFTELEGKIEFTTSTVQKNQICRWEIIPPRGVYRIELTIRAPGLGLAEANIPATLHIEMASLLGREYFQIPLNREVISYSFNVSQILFLFRTDHLIPNAMPFKVEYRVTDLYASFDFIDAILAPFRWIISLLSLFFITSCLIVSLQKLQMHIRRRRLLIELQELGEYDNEGVELASVDVDELFSNNRIINLMVYDQHITNDFQQTECSICLDEFKQTERLAKIVNCKHIFHVKCFEDWARSIEHQVVKCPICNHELA